MKKIILVVGILSFSVSSLLANIIIKKSSNNELIKLKQIIKNKEKKIAFNKLKCLEKVLKDNNKKISVDTCKINELKDMKKLSQKRIIISEMIAMKNR